MSAAAVKIVVIDGEAPIRRLLRMGFSTKGYEIIDAPNGRVAIELLAQKPDLITLDLNLPDIPGFELLKVIRMRAETIPIVVLSGRDDGASKVQAFDLGADDYVTKPFGMDEFFARVRVALRHQLHVHGERSIFRVNDLSVDLVRRIVNLSPILSRRAANCEGRSQRFRASGSWRYSGFSINASIASGNSSAQYRALPNTCLRRNCASWRMMGWSAGPFSQRYRLGWTTRSPTRQRSYVRS